ncbi:MFS transporter [Phenylobacterium sp.]|jgi:DHA2 family multidrug resistance protein-like MFS transporter|uniref:MFS transporter n=1 Tax=Phenylobacterium sp. TaxID=1871053 RepID=UPI002F3FB95B
MTDAVPSDLDGSRAPPEDGLPVPRRYWATATIWLAIGMSVLDSSIANVALPTIAREMAAGPAVAIWIVNAYQLAIAVCLLPFAALGDKLGYRRIYVAGLTVFTLGSLGCALAPDLTLLTAARVLQGLGAAGIMSINSALVRFTNPQRLLGRAIGVNAVVISVAAAVGPTVASAILAVASWRWLFALNVPIGVVTVLVALRALPRTEGSGRPFDIVSALLSAVAFGLLILGAESVAREGLAAGLSRLAVGAVAAGLLAWRELRHPAPLVPLDLLRIPIFGLSIATSIVSFGAQMLAFVALPFDFQGPLGRTAVETGLLMTPWPLAVGVAAPVAGRLADRYPAGLLGGVGLGIFAFGLAMLSILPPDASTADIVWRMAVCGLGFGCFQSPNNRAIVSSAPRERSGAAGGMLATARVLGQTGGAVTMAVLFRTIPTDPTRAALASAAAIACFAALVSLLRLRAGDQATRIAPGAQQADPT